ncbi:ABC transporter permease [Clostridium tetani]|uniref:ABC transporter permease/substrate-binding protein n=1 Tax=Clostridium tetani TaxID=1513 RepID=UPI00100AE996|nr:glycine betaine ABC transporter substrate-binding protein [Clostridium tetani]RXM77745.1 ABC transporter permease [Clostridium tetani]RYU99600.1 ABC transporter permease [Clostridium tetani]
MVFFNFVMERYSQILSLTGRHLQLTAIAVLLAIFIGVPIGILISRYKKAAPYVIGIANIVQAVPSLALLGFLIPIIGIGEMPSILMVFLYSLLPIIKNTYTSLENISPDIKEAGKAMGMTNYQLLTMVGLPLAFPIIMAGVRISSVTAVGLMTIAAYVGAGGLGDLIFAGIQSLNSSMILSGAIPACIMALLLDFIIGKIEKKASEKKSKNRKKTRRNRIIALSSCIILIISFGIFNYRKKANTIVIGSKDYVEQEVLGNLMAEMLKNHTDLNVETKFQLGGSSVVVEAIKKGDIDIYPEYTGVGLMYVLKLPHDSDTDRVYNTVKKGFKDEMNLEFLKPFGYNNTYAVAVRKDTAQEYDLKKVSDIANVSNNLKSGFTVSFVDRQDGLLGLEKNYGLKFKEVLKMDSGVRYSSLINKQTDVTDAFTTDGMLKSLDLVLLEDDKGVFPPYYAAPVIKSETLENYPEIEEILNRLADKISEKDMIEMNYNVDELGMTAQQSALNFLKKKGLID